MTGGLTQTVQVLATQARGEDGLCGYEAILFEPPEVRPSVRVAKELWALARWVTVYLVSSFMVWSAILVFVRWLAS